MSLAVVSRSCAMLTLALLAQRLQQLHPYCHLATKRILKTKQLPFVTIVLLRGVSVLLPGRDSPFLFTWSPSMPVISPSSATLLLTSASHH